MAARGVPGWPSLALTLLGLAVMPALAHACTLQSQNAGGAFVKASGSWAWTAAPAVGVGSERTSATISSRLAALRLEGDSALLEGGRPGSNLGSYTSSSESPFGALSNDPPSGRVHNARFGLASLGATRVDISWRPDYLPELAETYADPGFFDRVTTHATISRSAFCARHARVNAQFSGKKAGTLTGKSGDQVNYTLDYDLRLTQRPTPRGRGF